MSRQDSQHGAPDSYHHSLITSGPIIDCQLIPRGSNYIFLATISDEAGGQKVKAVYKPQEGEAPLWDFPTGTLYRREYAAYLVSQALGWDFVPLTVIRDGPYGTGSVQLFIDAVPGSNYFTLQDARKADFCRFFVFDCLVNNADRKAGHCLLDRKGHLWSVDHGITFHHMPKLRTVIQEFCGRPMPQELKRDLARLAGPLEPSGALRAELAGLLSQREIEALRGRLRWLLEAEILPLLDPYYSIPWPPV
ncbi:MAG: SCO1664 family protein [Chloroflexi bacterium]|nr:SCO1664 family protein [Chloroflexota bacterium]